MSREDTLQRQQYQQYQQQHQLQQQHLLSPISLQNLATYDDYRTTTTTTDYMTRNLSSYDSGGFTLPEYNSRPPPPLQHQTHPRYQPYGENAISDGEYRQVVHVTPEPDLPREFAQVSLRSNGFSTTVHHDLVDGTATHSDERPAHSGANPTRAPEDGLSVPVHETLTMGYTPEQRRRMFLLDNGRDSGNSRDSRDSRDAYDAGYVVASVEQTQRLKPETRREPETTVRRQEPETDREARRRQRRADKQRRQLQRIPIVHNGDILIRNRLPDHRQPLPTRSGPGEYTSSGEEEDGVDEDVNDDWGEHGIEAEEDDFTVPVRTTSRDNPFHRGFNVRRENPLFREAPSTVPARDTTAASAVPAIKRRVTVQREESISEPEVVEIVVSHPKREVPVKAYREGDESGDDRVDASISRHVRHQGSRDRSKSRDSLVSRRRDLDEADDGGFDQEVNVTRG